MEGWIKLHRKFTQWEWYDNSQMVHLFLHLLLNVNHADGNWRGINVRRGQMITGLKSLSLATGISIQTLRSCLKKLEKTGEINKQTNNQFSIITVCKYDDYNGVSEATNKQPNKRSTNDQQATNKQLTTNKKKKNKKNEKNEKNNTLVVPPPDEEKKSDIKLKNVKRTETPLNEYENIAHRFYTLLRDIRSEKGISTAQMDNSSLSKWADSIRLMFTADNRSKNELIDLYDYLKKGDGFWETTVQSTAGLRKNADKILLKARRNGKTESDYDGRTKYTTSSNRESDYD